MTRVIDMEIGMPASEANPELERIARGRPGTPFPQPLERPEGYGFANYGKVFKARNREEGPAHDVDDGGLDRLVEDMNRANIACGLLVGAENSATGKIHARYPGRFFTFVTFDPTDGMRAVREFERLVKEEGANGLRLSALFSANTGIRSLPSKATFFLARSTAAGSAAMRGAASSARRSAPRSRALSARRASTSFVFSSIATPATFRR